MVYAEVGMSVWYYHGGNTKERFAGIITAVYHDLVDLYIFPPASAGAVRDGVPHVEDPRAKDKRRAAFIDDVGLWDYTDITRDSVLFLLQKKKNEAEEAASVKPAKQLAKVGIG